MSEKFSEPLSLAERVRLALQEDQVFEDLSTLSLVEVMGSERAAAPTRFVIRAKEAGVFSGRAWAEAMALEMNLRLTTLYAEGQRFEPGAELVLGEGSAPAILGAERSLLNELQRLSGIATLTARFVEKVKELWKESGPPPGVYHTRKTRALWRDLEVQAVLAGGGKPHRRSLGERVLLKENHKDWMKRAGFSWKEAVAEVIKRHPDALIEVESVDEAQALAQVGVRHLLLDNFTPAALEHYLSLKLPLESVEISGGLTLESLGRYLKAGVNRLSVGALTHSARALDLSLDWK